MLSDLLELSESLERLAGLAVIVLDFLKGKKKITIVKTNRGGSIYFCDKRALSSRVSGKVSVFNTLDNSLILAWF